MTDPWKTDEPFKLMFTDIVEISGVRPQGRSFRSPVRCCVYPVTDENPFAETDADSDIRRMTVLVIKSGCGCWCREFDPQIGDCIKLEDNSKWNVSKVEDRLGWYELEAKSC